MRAAEALEWGFINRIIPSKRQASPAPAKQPARTNLARAQRQLDRMKMHMDMDRIAQQVRGR